MRSGLLRHSITFQEKTTFRDTFGASVNTWIDKFTTKANIVFKNGSKTVENKELFNSQTIDINIRFRSDINEQMRIKCKNDYYEILFINPAPLYRELIISVNKLTNSEQSQEPSFLFDGGDIDGQINQSAISMDGGEI